MNRCPCCGFEPRKGLRLQVKKALLKKSPDVEVIINTVTSIINKYIYKGNMAISLNEKFIIGIGKSDNDIIYNFCKKYIDEKWYTRGRDLSYLSRCIINESNTKKVRKEYELNVHGTNPPEIK